MSSLKRYNEATSQWEYVAIGKQGITGATGPTGPTGPGVATGGTTGQVLAKSSNTNNDTTWINNYTSAQTDTLLNAKANLSGATFTGAVSATSFSGAATGLTGTAPNLTANALGGGTNITTYVDMSTIQANTNTKIASLNFPDGMYAVCIRWASGYAADGVSNHYWACSYSGITGITSASGYFNGSPQQTLSVSGVQHHRTQPVPTFLMYSDSTSGAYGILTLYINTPVLTRFFGLEVILKRLL